MNNPRHMNRAELVKLAEGQRGMIHSLQVQLTKALEEVVRMRSEVIPKETTQSIIGKFADSIEK